MKKIFFLIGFIGLAFIFNSCAAGYVPEEPTYVVVERPYRPSNNHVWVNDGWNYNHRTRSYTHNEGNWAAPNNGRTYVPGRWKQNKHGYRWLGNRWR